MDMLLDEVESLEAILMDDVKVSKNSETGFPELIETIVFPTVGGDTDRQYICVTLQVIPTAEYPEVSPKFQLLKPRGLDDTRISEIKKACIEKLNDSIGYPVVFDLIEVIREHLTGSNLPSGQCVVCLYGFQEGDEFSKTECYHYLHSFCLARHLSASKKNFQEEIEKLPAWQRKLAKPFQAVCPVCREPIKDDTTYLTNAPPPTELQSAPDFQLTNELKELQTKMTNLYLRQKSRGGIIDLDAEESNVISLEPDDPTAEDDKVQDERNDESTNTNPNPTGGEPRNVPAMPNLSHTRSNSSRNSNRTTSRNNIVSSANNSPRYTTPESTNNNYSHHHQRRGHNHHHRGRRYHHHHHNHIQEQQSQDATSQQQQKGNSSASCGPHTR